MALRIATFLVSGCLFGVDVPAVQEVLRFQKMTRVPRAPKVIQGLINLRGQIVPAIDMRERLGLEPRAPHELSMNLIVRGQDGAVSLLVDDMGDVLQIDEAHFEYPPANLAPAMLDLVRGVYKLKDRLLFVLDTERTMDIRAVI